LVPSGPTSAEFNASGARVSGDPGSGILGLVQGGAMEESNADLNENLVNMIIAQREFQGNSQILGQIDMDLSLAKL
jgi:flagellar hook protein FlgE